MHHLRRFFDSPWSVFAACWMLLFLLYLPAANAGWVSDTLGWLDAVRHQSFAHFVQRSGMGVHTFYQTTQVVTWLLYQVLGSNAWAWNLLHISLQALSATLLFALMKRLFADSNLQDSPGAGWIAVLLFCSAPHISEVIVWEAAFHYLLALLFQVSILLLMLRSLRRWNRGEAMLALLVMLVAAASLEVFYLTPAIMVLVLVYYGKTQAWPPALIKKVVRFFLLPQIAIVAAHLLVSKLVFGTVTARLGDAPLHQSIRSIAVKPPMLLFHLFGGRFLSQAARDVVYAAFCTYAGAGVFYAALCGPTMFAIIRFRRQRRAGALRSILFFWLLAALAFAAMLWLPTRLLILGDRYLYFILPPFCLLITMLILRIRAKALRMLVAGSIITLQCAATLHLSILWKHSDILNRSIVRNFPARDTNRIILLLNNPHSLCGAPMIGAGQQGELALARRLFWDDSIRAKVYEVAAADLEDKSSLPRLAYLNDSTIYVGFEHEKPCWWRSSDYLQNYATLDYEVRTDSANISAYTILLKGDRRRFVPMYTAGGHWYVLGR